MRLEFDSGTAEHVVDENLDVEQQLDGMSAAAKRDAARERSQLGVEYVGLDPSTGRRRAL